MGVSVLKLNILLFFFSHTQCSCSGYTKRKVSCYDARLNKLSNSCSEREKPFVKKKCIPPPNCSCKDIHLRMGKHIDGEYDLNVKGRKIRIYCYNMHTNNPLEYLTLKGGKSGHFPGGGIH